MVKIFQIHKDLKTSRKYQHNKCKFHFGKFFSERTIVAGFLPRDVPD